jgi:hypothetical protein
MSAGMARRITGLGLLHGPPRRVRLPLGEHADSVACRDDDPEHTQTVVGLFG